MSDMVSVPAEKIAALREALSLRDKDGSGWDADIRVAARAVVDAVETDDEAGPIVITREELLSEVNAEKAWHHWAIEVAPMNRSPHDAFLAGYAAHMAAADELTALRKAKTHWHMAYKGLEDGIRALADEWESQPDLQQKADAKSLRALLGDA